MSINPNQLDVPFTQAEEITLEELATKPGVPGVTAVASVAEATAGLDNASLMTPLRVAQAISALAGAGGGNVNDADNLGAGVGLYSDKNGMNLEFKSLVAGTGITLSADSETITLSAVTGGLFLNSTGVTIPGMSIVWQDTSGNMHPFTSPSVEVQISNVLGLLLDDAPTGTQSTVYSSGYITNITTFFSLGNTIYLSKAGGMTSLAPDIGNGGFAVGDFVLRIGIITKNAVNSLNLDFNLDVKLIGQL